MQVKKDNQTVEIKVVLLGDCGVGKTNIFTRLHTNEFSLESKSTKDVNHFTNNLMIEDKILKVQVFDTAGDKKFLNVKKAFLKNAKIAIIVCDISKSQTFRSWEKWHNYAKTYADPQITTIVVGNKADLNNLREVQSAEISNILESRGIPYLDISALNSTNIETMYHRVLSESYMKLKQKQFK